ncbi:hypothetical protein MHYP_G00160880 [Metynnis hypsauchen]
MVLKSPRLLMSLWKSAVSLCGETVGHDSILSASRMNGWIVLFLNDVDKVTDVVTRGIILDGQFTSVVPLITPSKRVTLSNVPPFIRDDTLLRELSRFGQIMSPIKIDNFDYTVFATTEIMKCFGCGGDGHLIWSCPERLPGPAPCTEASGTASAEAEEERDGEGAQETGPESRPGTAGGEHDSTGKESDGAGCSVTVEEDAAQSECRTEEKLNNDREHEHSTDPLVDTVTDIVDFVLDSHQTMPCLKPQSLKGKKSVTVRIRPAV